MSNQREADKKYVSDMAENKRLGDLSHKTEAELNELLTKESDEIQSLQVELKAFWTDVQEARLAGASDEEVWGDQSDHISYPETMQMEIGVHSDNVREIVKMMAKRGVKLAQIVLQFWKEPETLWFSR